MCKYNWQYNRNRFERSFYLASIASLLVVNTTLGKCTINRKKDKKHLLSTLKRYPLISLIIYIICTYIYRQSYFRCIFFWWKEEIPMFFLTTIFLKSPITELWALIDFVGFPKCIIRTQLHKSKTNFRLYFPSNLFQKK